jgi:glycerate dehydrogenase
MKMVVLDGYTLNPGDNPWDALAGLGDLVVYERSHDTEVASRCRGAEIVLTNKARITREVIEQNPSLRLIAVTATGYDCVDVAAASQAGIPVCNVPVYGTDSVAQFVFALLLELARQPALHHEAVKNGEWAKQPDWTFWKTPLMELTGKTMGIIGFGRIGRRVGGLAHAFGMQVLAHDIKAGSAPNYQPFAWAGLDEVFSRADVVTLHAYQTEENAGFINRGLMRKMKKTAFLINTSRGGLINESDLAAVLNEGLLAGAALDVVSVEPIRDDNPLWTARNLIITPHIAWAAMEARKRLMDTTVHNVKAFLNGEPQNIVNPF